MATDLIIVVQSPVIPIRDEVPHVLIAEANPVVEVAEPDHRFMVCNGPVHLEPQTPVNRLVVPVPLVIVCKPGSQVSGDQADTCVREVKTDGAAALVAADS